MAQDNTYLFSRLLYDVHRAEDITVPAAAGLSSSQLQLTIDGADYIYAINNGNLELTSPEGTEVLNGYNTTLVSLDFSRIGNGAGTDTIQITYTLESRGRDASGPVSSTVQTTVGLR